MSIIESVFNVFGEVTEWFVTTIPSLTSIFYAESQLTVIGVMTIASVGVGLALLLFNYVKDLISFR